jgi:hypothetical protein
VSAPANPFGQYIPDTNSGTVTPAPVSVAPTQNPNTVSPSAQSQADAYQAFLAEQARIQAAAAQAAVAPPAPPAAPPVDHAFLAWQAQQAAQLAPQQQMTMPAQVPPGFPAGAPAVQPPQFLAPPAGMAAPASGGTDPFDDPAPRRPKGPRLEEMYGRLILIMPKGMDRGKGTDSQGNATEYDRMTADVIILDGGPIAFGGDPSGRPPVPHDQWAQVPHRNVAMFISAGGLISQSRDAWAKRQRGEPGMVIGRLAVGEKKNPQHQAPWILDKATDADKALARQYLATIDPFA